MKENYKKINKLLKKAKIKDNDTQEVKNLKLINYVAKKKSHFEEIYLSKEQRKDPNFLINLYHANENMISFQSPDSEIKNLVNSSEFMTSYIKLAFEKSSKNLVVSNDIAIIKSQQLQKILEPYILSIENPLIIENLFEEFPDLNILEILNNSLICSNNYANNKSRENLKNLILKISQDSLCNQARTFGKFAIKYIPSDLSFYNEIINCGIEKDGFQSLQFLNIDRLLENENLIIKAFNKDGLENLKKFIFITLSPYKLDYYRNYGKFPQDCPYIKKYEILKKMIFENINIFSQSSANLITNDERQKGLVEIQQDLLRE